MFYSHLDFIRVNILFLQYGMQTILLRERILYTPT